MRIIYFSNSYPPYISGTAIFVSTLAKKMAEAGHEVMMVAPSMDGRLGKFKTGHLTEYFLQSISNPFRQFHTLFWVPAAEVKALIAEFKPDVIHYNDLGLWPFVIAPWARTKKISLVFTQHGMLDYIVFFLPLGRFILPWLTKEWQKALELFDIITVPSLTMKSHLITDIGVTKKNLKIISNGVDCQHFSVKKNLQNKLALKKLPQKLKLLYVGRFEIEKAVLVLLRAVALVKTPVQLRLVGNGGQLAALQKEISKLNLTQKVELVKALPEKQLKKYYHWADVFVMPSPMEAQSIVTLQALACGLPVIGPNSGALPELVLPTKTGWLFKSGSSQDLAKKIQLASKSSLETRKRFGLAARNHALKHDARKVFQAWLKLYRDL